MVGPPLQGPGSAGDVASPREVPFAPLLAMGYGQALAANLLDVGFPLTVLHLGGAAYVLGLSYTAWAVTRSLSGFWAGRRLDASGTSRLVPAFTLFVVAALAYAMGPAPWWIVAGRLAQGLGAGLYWSEILVRAGATPDARHRMRRLATFNAAVALGGVSGALLGAGSVAWLGPRAPSWVASGVLAVLAAYAGRQASAASPRTSAAGPSGRRGHAQRAVLWGPGAALGIAVLAALTQLPILLSGVGLPLLLRDHGLPGSVLGLENGAIVGATLLGQIALARWASADPAPKIRLLSAALVVTLLLVAVGHAWTGWLLVCIVVLAALVSLLGVVWVHAAQVGAGERVGEATGTVRAVGDAVAAVSFPFVGTVEASLTAASLVLAGVVAACAAAFSALRPKGHARVRGT